MCTEACPATVACDESPSASSLPRSSPSTRAKGLRTSHSTLKECPVRLAQVRHVHDATLDAPPPASPTRPLAALHDSDTPAGVMGQLPEDVMKRETGCASHSRSGNGRDGLGRACKGAELGRTDCVRLLPSFSTFRATVSAAPDLRKPASPGGSGYTVNTSSSASSSLFLLRCSAALFLLHRISVVQDVQGSV